jgi:hypothetical protein
VNEEGYWIVWMEALSVAFAGHHQTGLTEGRYLHPAAAAAAAAAEGPV